MSSSALPELGSTFFIDRSMGRRPALALREAGFRAIAHDEQFRQDAKDQEWLQWAGHHGLIVITQDKQIRRRPAELAVFKASGVLAFIVAAGDVRGAEAVMLVLSRAGRMLEIAAAEPRPAAYSIHRDGRLRKLELPG